MKTILFFTLAFILCILSAKSGSENPVLDIHGESLRSGVKYYVMPLGWSEWSSIMAAPVGNKSCPAGVVLGKDKYGQPLTFTPANPKKGVIRLGADLNIKFSASSICTESNVWKLKYDKGIGDYAVMVGGAEGNPGPETLYNWFQILKDENGYYKFAYCPSVCSNCKEVMCREVTVTEDRNGVQRLATNEDPFVSPQYIAFHKA